MVRLKAVTFSIDGPQEWFCSHHETLAEAQVALDMRKRIAEMASTAVVQSTDRVLTTVDYEIWIEEDDEDAADSG